MIHQAICSRFNLLLKSCMQPGKQTSATSFCKQPSWLARGPAHFFPKELAERSPLNRGLSSGFGTKLTRLRGWNLGLNYGEEIGRIFFFRKSPGYERWENKSSKWDSFLSNQEHHKHGKNKAWGCSLLILTSLTRMPTIYTIILFAAHSTSSGGSKQMDNDLSLERLGSTT